MQVLFHGHVICLCGLEFQVGQMRVVIRQIGRVCNRGRNNFRIRHLYLRSYENKINLLPLSHRYPSKIMESIAFSCLFRSYLPRIFQYDLIGCNCYKSFPFLRNIKVSGHHRGVCTGYLFYLINNKQCTVPPGFCPYVIKMSIYHQEFFSGGFLLQFSPGGNTGTGSIPTKFTDTIRMFGQPECIAVQ